MDDFVIHQDVIGFYDILPQAQFYPNPTTGVMNISFTDDMHEVKILDFSGRIVYCQKLNSTSAKLDLSFLNKGIYMAEIISGNKRQTSKFVLTD